MECCCCLRNVQDLLADGKTPYERRFGEPFEGPVISLDAMVEYHPIFCKRPVGIQTLMYKSPRLHEDVTTRTGLALWSGLTMETGSHPWVPAGHPQYTGAHHDGKAVDGPKPPQLTRKPLRTLAW